MALWMILILILFPLTMFNHTSNKKYLKIMMTTKQKMTIMMIMKIIRKIRMILIGIMDTCLNRVMKIL